MKIIVAPHDLAIGGSQINAIDLAAAVRDLGHDVIVYGTSGPAVAHVEQHGLRFVHAPAQPYRPAPQRIVHLARLARREGIDIIHAYEWPPCLDAYFGRHAMPGTALVCTVLSMHVPSVLPRSVPVIMGTEQLGVEARRRGSRHVSVLEPPIDVIHDHPGIDGSEMRRMFGVDPATLLVVTVSRLSIDLKLDALERAIDAVGDLAQRTDVRLLVVGGGEAESHLRHRADRVNRRFDRPVITLTGEQLDPRPFYAAADIVLGMGSSALRAASMARPVVVQGDAGFSKVFEPVTAHEFLHQGFWGIGDHEAGPRRLVGDLERLVEGGTEFRDALGTFGRATVVDRFDLDRAASRLVDHYESVLAAPRRVTTAEMFAEMIATSGRAFWAELKLHDPRRKRRVHAVRCARLRRAEQPYFSPIQQRPTTAVT